MLRHFLCALTVLFAASLVGDGAVYAAELVPSPKSQSYVSALPSGS